MPDGAERLAQARGLLGSGGHLLAGAEHPPLLQAPHRIFEAQGQHHQHQRRQGEDHKRRPPAPPEGQQSGQQGPERGAEHVGRAVHGEDPGPIRRREPVGQQGVVGRVVHRLADRRAGPSDQQQRDGGGHAGQEAETRPGHRAGAGDQHPVAPVGVPGDRDLQQQRRGRHAPDHSEDLGYVEPEMVRDVGHQQREAAAVELVHHVEAEQHQQRVQRPVAGQRPPQAPAAVRRRRAHRSSASTLSAGVASRISRRSSSWLRRCSARWSRWSVVCSAGTSIRRRAATQRSPRSRPR